MILLSLLSHQVDLVVGAAVGGSVAMAAVVIVMRFLYRRCWYGKYNLLNE